MLAPDQLVTVYTRLAEWNESQGQPDLRDRFLVLAADAALHAGRSDEAERLRRRLLQVNPHHLLRPYASFVEALASPDVQSYIGELRWKYPPATAEKLLEATEAGELRRPSHVDRPIPPTVPSVDVEGPPPFVDGWDDEDEAPAVYRLRQEEQAPRPATTAPPSPRPGSGARKAAVPPPAPRPSPVPAYAPPPLPVDVEPPRPRRGPAADDVPTGAWLSTALFVLTLVAGLALAVYSVARPFLPAGWHG